MDNRHEENALVDNFSEDKNSTVKSNLLKGFNSLAYEESALIEELDPSEKCFVLGYN